MCAYQTTVQEANTIRFGSATVYVGEDESSLVNLGAMRGITFEESWDKTRVMADNAGEVSLGVRNPQAALSGDLMEVNLENLHLLRGGIDNLETVEGTEVTGETQTETQGDWGYGEIILIDNQNADGTQNNITDVSGSTDGSLTEGDDYEIVQDSLDRWGVIILEAGTITSTESQDITITYDYTPAEKYVMESGGNVSIDPRVVQIVNENAAGEQFIITIFKATTEEGISLEFPADEDEDPLMTSINLNGTLDANREPGQALFRIEDEQGVSNVA